MSKYKVTEEDINNAILTEEYLKLGKKTTICLLTLKNGFEIVGKSGCVDESNYNHEIGKGIAYKDALNQIWLLEGYVMQNLMQFELSHGVETVYKKELPEGEKEIVYESEITEEGIKIYDGE